MANLPSVGSASNLGILITTVADDTGIKQTQGELAGLGATAESATAASASSLATFNSNLKAVGQQMMTVGRSLTAFVTLPIVGIAAASTKMAMTFQQDMELLVTNAGVSQGAIKGLSDQVLAMAPQVGQGPDALATAFFHIATAGQGIWNTAQQLNVLKVSAEGAAIGQANLDDTTYALTSTLAANVVGATDAQTAMGLLLGTVQAGDMHLSDLNEVIGTGLMGTLSTFGVSLQSAGAALADFGDLGEKGAAAGNRLRMMLTLMTSPSKAAAKLLGDLGLTTDETATATSTMNDVFAKTGLTTTKLADDLRQPNGIYVAITDLKSHLEAAGLSASQTDAILSKAFGGGRTDSALLQLLNTTDRLDLKFQQIGQDTSKFADNWAKQQQTAKQQWDQAWGGIQADMIKIGVLIMPQVTTAMNQLAAGITAVTNWFTNLSSGQKQFVIDAAAVLAIMGPVLLVFGTLATSISAIITLVTTLAPAFAAAATAIGVSGALIGGVLLGIVADAVLVVKAFQSVTGALSAVDAANKSAQEAKDAKSQELSTLQNLMAHGTPQQQLNASTVYRNDFGSGFASGTNYAPGGWSMVGENGPEAMYVPQGSMIKTNPQTSSLGNSNSSGGITLYQTNNNYSQFDLNQANRELSWRLSNAI